MGVQPYAPTQGLNIVSFAGSRALDFINKPLRRNDMCGGPLGQPQNICATNQYSRPDPLGGRCPHCTPRTETMNFPLDHVPGID